ncbi:unnamed protein product [Amaranthus hypochondriacus]
MDNGKGGNAGTGTTANANNNGLKGGNPPDIMVAPGSGGASTISRAEFEKNPQAYFQEAHKNAKK